MTPQRVIKPPPQVLLRQLLPALVVGMFLTVAASRGAWFSPGAVIALVVAAAAAGVLQWWRVQFEIGPSGEVTYRPFLGARRQLVPGPGVNVVQFQALTVAGTKNVQAFTVLVDGSGQRIAALPGAQWSMTELDRLIAPLVRAGAEVQVLTEPTRVRDLPEHHRRVLPWAVRRPGQFAALLVAVVAIVLVVSALWNL